MGWDERPYSQSADLTLAIDRGSVSAPRSTTGIGGTIRAAKRARYGEWRMEPLEPWSQKGIRVLRRGEERNPSLQGKSHFQVAYVPNPTRPLAPIILAIPPLA